MKDHEIPVRLFAPDDRPEPDLRGYPVLLFFHDGGWVISNIDSYSKVCVAMARLTQHMVLAVDYRLAPEHRFPAAPEDCYCVTQELLTHAQHLGIDPKKITLIGDSAGGNLAAAVSLMARDRGGMMPRRQILLYPATYNDHTDASPFPSIRENGTGYLLTSKRVCDYMELYKARPSDRYNPYFAPLLAKSFANQPDTLVITAEFDPLRDEGEAYARRLQQAGNRVTGVRIRDALHGFFALSPSFAIVQEAYGHINRFLSEEIGD